jgi:uncharacterized protein YndB with AHSA1/START domain
MTDILQNFPIKVAPARVFDGVSAPALLDEWWTLRSTGQPTVGSIYELDFGPDAQWQAVVTKAVPGEVFELKLTRADADWIGSTVSFELAPSRSGTAVRFAHRGWPEASDHYRSSCHCWALYLRVLRRHLEHGESVPYDRRLDV